MNLLTNIISALLFITHSASVDDVSPTPSNNYNKQTESSTSEPVAVVELFTSQGCSSCPRADQLLIDLNGKLAEKSVFFLSFHVAYWDYLGWKDPYSSESFSRRQRRYSQYLASNTYTPQMVFNGQYECVGSAKDKVINNINACLKTKSAAKINLRQLSFDEETITVDYGIEGSLTEASLLIALVQKSVETNVKRGENHGRILKHHNVVRHLVVLDKPNANGTTAITVPQNLTADELLLIGFVQDNNSLEIRGASKLQPKN